MLAKRGSRAITVGKIEYRWTARKKHGSLLVSIQNLKTNGQLFVARVAEDTYDMGDVELVHDPIKPSFVAKLISWGLANGWKPEAGGKVFQIDCYESGILPDPNIRIVSGS